MRKTRRQHSGKGRQRNTRRRWYQQRGGIRTGTFANIPNNNNGAISSDDAYPAQKEDYITQNTNRMIIKVVPKTQEYYLYHAGLGEFHPVSSPVLSSKNNNNPANRGNGSSIGSSYGSSYGSSSSSISTISNNSKKPYFMKTLEKNNFEAQKRKFGAWMEKMNLINKQKVALAMLNKMLIQSLAPGTNGEPAAPAPAPAPATPAPATPAPATPAAPAPAAPPAAADVNGLINQINQNQIGINQQNETIVEASKEQTAGRVLHVAENLVDDVRFLYGDLFGFLYGDEEASLSSADTNSTNSSNLKFFQDLANERYDDQDDNKTMKSVTENTPKDQSIVNALQEVAQHSKGRNTYEQITQNDEQITQNDENNIPIYKAYVNNTLHYSEMPPQQKEILNVTDDDDTKLIKLDFERFYDPEFINTCLSEKFPKSDENNENNQKITSFLESVTYVDFLNNEEITKMITMRNKQLPNLYPSNSEWTDMKHKLDMKTFTFNNSPSVDTNNDSKNYKKFLDVLEGTLIKNINNYLNYLYKCEPLSFYKEIVINDEFGVGWNTFEMYLSEKNVFKPFFSDFTPPPIEYIVLIDNICNAQNEVCQSRDEFYDMILKYCGYNESDEIREQIINEFTKTLTSDLDVPYLSNYFQMTIQKGSQSITMPLSMYLLQLNHIVTQTQLKLIRIYVMVNKLKAYFQMLYKQRNIGQ